MASTCPVINGCSGLNLSMPHAAYVFGICGAITAIGMLVCCCIRLLRRQDRRVSNVDGATVAMAAANPMPPDNVRLDAATLASLPTFVYSSATHGDKLDCAVCLMDFQNGEEGRLLPSCGHNFHKECVDMWFGSNSTCPYCRAIVGSDVSQLPV